jgi:hypothetical protein
VVPFQAATVTVHYGPTVRIIVERLTCGEQISNPVRPCRIFSLEEQSGAGDGAVDRPIAHAGGERIDEQNVSADSIKVRDGI